MSSKDKVVAYSGKNKIYNSNDEVFIDATFANGKLMDGKIYIYDKYEILLRVEVFEDGAYCNDGQL